MGSEKDNDGHTSSADGLGLSLWLVPPKDSEIHDALVDAIARMVPSALAAEHPPPQFEPHLTLTSHIPRRSITGDPQTWLDGIDLPATSAVEVDFQELAIGDAFFKKLFIRCRRSDSLLSLASACRELSSGAKVDEALYDPHVSLL
jgi:2',3'-cyclic-nucleotide 3'-phosphodiesterase